MSTAEAYNGAGGRRDPGVIGRMWAMIVKEFVQMRRDRMTFATMLFVPILQLTLFGFAINTDPKDLPTAVLVRDDGPLTRAVLSAMKNTDYFDFKHQVRSAEELDQLVRTWTVPKIWSAGNEPMGRSATRIPAAATAETPQPSAIGRTSLAVA